MTQANKSINSHIEEYLDYYCDLSHAPGFAVLLKGQWGSGKTWFINRFREKLKNNNCKCLYVSLYGMTSFAEIEDAFFQQLHPFLSSKGMAITGKLLKGVLKGTLKIDLTDDGKDDGTLNLQIPDINLPEYLKDTDKSILIFDDLERCNIELSNILGYINYFVEHQCLKVVLVANEDKLLENSNYQFIKEKLIGKTFTVFSNFEGALENFITLVNDSQIRNFLSENTELIKLLYDKAGYKNLRALRQIILDFGRIFELLPEEAQRKSEFLQDLLKLLMAFSIEIKRGKMVSTEISKLRNEYSSAITKQAKLNRGIEDNNEKQTSLEEVLSRYPELNLHAPFPSTKWWETFFDKGIVDTQELEQAILNSRYFQDENTPNWVRLWHFYNLSDDEFDNLLKKVESEYTNRQFDELGVIKHITGIFLKVSELGLYYKSQGEILKEAKLYIDYLKGNNRSKLIPVSTIEDVLGGYGGLGFQGRELTEFKEFYSYINEVRELARFENMPKDAENLLIIMQNDIWKFYSMVCLSNSQERNASSEFNYYQVPILKYIKAKDFINKVLLMKHEDQGVVFEALQKRYEFDSSNGNLVEEIEWLKSVQNLLLEEASRKKGKLSGYRLNTMVKDYLIEIIRKLEAKKSQAPSNQ